MKKIYISPAIEQTGIKTEGHLLIGSIDGTVSGAVGTRHQEWEEPDWDEGWNGPQLED